MKKLFYLILLMPFAVKAQTISPIDSATYATRNLTITMAKKRTLDSMRNVDTLRRNVLLANKVNTSALQTVTITAGNGIFVSGTPPNFTIAIVAPTINASPGRALNSNFTISTTKTAYAYYTLSCAVTNPLLAGTSVGTAYLEYSTNSGSTWNSVTSIANSSNVGITVTLQLTNSQTSIIGGIIPANALVRIRTVTSGTATITYISGEEIVY